MRATRSASALVDVNGADLRSLTIARAIFARQALLAVMKENIGEMLFIRRVDEIGGACAAFLHAHVERTIEPERKASFGFVELHGRDADIEDDAVERSEFLGGAARSPKRVSTSVSRPANSATSAAPPQSRSDRDRARQRALSFSRKDCPRIAARPECRVEIEAARLYRERFDGSLAKHGNVPGRSASGAWRSGAAAPIIPVLLAALAHRPHTRPRIGR